MSRITEYVIIVSATATTNERRAASFLRENIKLVCGKAPEIRQDSAAPVPCEIVVGKTSREVLDGVSFPRSREGVWEYELRLAGKRLYLTGLGVPPETEPPYTSAYRKLDDGCVGTVLAAYHFVEDILGYQFVYATFDAFPENETLEMPEQYAYSFTRAAFRRQLPQKMEGATLHFLQCSECLDMNNQSFIIQTAAGKLIVFDGGHPEETERLLRSLEHLAGDKKPHVSAWFFSHLHDDHYGVYLTLCQNEALRARLTVEKFYCHLLPEEFYTKLSPEAREGRATVRRLLLESADTVGAEVVTVQKGDVIRLDEIAFEVIHVPDMAFATKMNMNDSSVVYKMLCGGQSVLFLGDAEWVCNNDLLENCRESLKSDVVQVGHHGCGNVSRECYEVIGATAYLWPIGPRFWYGESGEGLNTHNTGVIRSRVYMKEIGVKPENVYVNMDRIISLPLPIPLA